MEEPRTRRHRFGAESGRDLISVESMKSHFYLVLGVSASGKIDVGRLPAQHLGWDFYDADDFHPPENVVKMSSGIPLSDSDRAFS